MESRDLKMGNPGKENLNCMKILKKDNSEKDNSENGDSGAEESETRQF